MPRHAIGPRINVFVSQDEIDGLDRLADRHHTSRGEIIRRGIQLVLNEQLTLDDVMAP